MKTQKQQYKIAFVEKSCLVNTLKENLASEETKNAELNRDKQVLELKNKDQLRQLKYSKYLRLAFAVENLFRLKMHQNLSVLHTRIIDNKI